jgi:xanthine/CO dehydrogenase XdhC/CoxF family maturation factor
MYDILTQIDHWLEEKQPIALATVVQTWGSAPRGVGAKMAVIPGGEMAGSVSGGCVEGAVIETGIQILKTGRPQLLHFGVADETAWEVVLTHDIKLDDPGLKVALASPAFYVGALGSRKTQAQRRQRLLEQGLSETEVDRLHGPIGLNIGAQTPEEIALAIMGEVVAAYRSGI